MDTNTALKQATGQGDNVGNILQQEKTELAPMQKQVGESSAQQVPAPDLKKAPEAPEVNMSQDAAQWVGVMNVLAGIGGLKSRDGATTALSAFSSGLNSFKQGKLDAFKEAQTQWADANKGVIENNKAQVDAYKEALKDKKLSVDEQMANIKLVASQYHNDIMSTLAEQRNFTAVARVTDMMQSNNDKLELQYEKLKTTIDKVNDHASDAEKATAAYKNLYYPNGQVVGKPPPFMQWYKTDWKTVKDNEGGGGESPSDSKKPSAGVPLGLPDPKGHEEGSTAKDGSGKVVAIIKDGVWAAP